MSPEHPEILGALCTFLVMIFIMTLLFELDNVMDPTQSPYTFGMYAWGTFMCAFVSILTAVVWKVVLCLIIAFLALSLTIFTFTKINKLIAYLALGCRDKKSD